MTNLFKKLGHHIKRNPNEKKKRPITSPTTLQHFVVVKPKPPSNRELLTNILLTMKYWLEDEITGGKEKFDSNDMESILTNIKYMIECITNDYPLDARVSNEYYMK